MNQRYRSSHRLLIITTICLVVVFSVGYWQRTLFLNENIGSAILISLGLLAFFLKNQNDTYLEIQNNRTVVSSGYRDFGKDSVDLLKIKYIYRIPQFQFTWFGGSLMLVYSENEDGKITHVTVRERSYSEEILESFLKRIQELCPKIEFDPEYKEFLNGKRTLEEPSSNSVQGIERRLKERGEVW